MMTKCLNCKKSFPDSLLSPLIINGHATEPMCGICALKLRNESMGLPLDELFQGEQARLMYEKALKFLKEKRTG